MMSIAGPIDETMQCSGRRPSFDLWKTDSGNIAATTRQVSDRDENNPTPNLIIGDFRCTRKCFENEFHGVVAWARLVEGCKRQRKLASRIWTLKGIRIRSINGCVVSTLTSNISGLNVEQQFSSTIE